MLIGESMQVLDESSGQAILQLDGKFLLFSF